MQKETTTKPWLGNSVLWNRMNSAGRGEGLLIKEEN